MSIVFDIHYKELGGFIYVLTILPADTHTHGITGARLSRTMGIHGANFKTKVRWEASYLSFLRQLPEGRTMETLGESVNLMIFPH